MVERIKSWKPPYQIKVVEPRKPKAKQEQRAADVKFYQSAEWTALKLQVKREQPICAKPDCHELAKHVHHKKPRKLFPELALVRSNLEGLCIPHHNAEKVR